MKILFSLMIINLTILSAQGQGVVFESGLSSEEMFAKAKSENKYIFIECYATWCTPCKKMEKEVFTSLELGGIVNKRFISMRLQMDTSKNDEELTKKHYSFAADIKKQYNILSIPTFLFFNSNGKIVHRDYGYKNSDQFINTVIASLDTSKQFYTQLENYNRGIKNFAVMPYLARACKAFGDDKTAKAVSYDYIKNYLAVLPDKEFYVQGNIQFLMEFTESTNDIGFNKFYGNTEKIDKGMGVKGFASNFINFLIKKSEIYPLLWQNGQKATTKPSWNQIEKKVRRKYGKGYAERAIWDAQTDWFISTSKFEDFSKVLVKRVEKYGAYGVGNIDFQLNNHAWSLFLHSSDKNILSIALNWSDSAVKINPIANWIDTKANILYKLGRKKEAIEFEAKAVALDPSSKDFSSNLEKMKNDKPTW